VREIDTVILAAGKGSRMKDYTYTIPKCLVPINGKPIIDYILQNLLELGIKRVIFVVGYKKDKLISYIKENYGDKFELEFVINDNIDRENGYSLYCARDCVKTDKFLLLMSDHIVDGEIYNGIRDVAWKGDIILATSEYLYYNDMDDVTRVLLDDDRILHIGKKISEYNAYDTGVFVMSKKVFDVASDLEKQKYKFGVSDIVNECIKRKMAVFAYDISNYFWADIDTPQDIGIFSE